MNRTVLLAATLPTLVFAATPQSPAAMLSGRTAGAPRDCISAFDRDRETQLFRDGSILYRGRGDTMYVNHPDSCPAFRSDTTIVSQTPSGELCRGDIIQVVEPTSGAFVGSCPLNQFTPYSHAR